MEKGPGLGSNPGSDTRQQMDRSLHLSEPQSKVHKLPSQVGREWMGQTREGREGRSRRLTSSESSVPLIHLLNQTRSPALLPNSQAPFRDSAHREGTLRPQDAEATPWCCQ